MSPSCQQGKAQKDFVPVAMWESFLEGVGMELNYGFINVSGLHGNPRNLGSHGASRFYSCICGLREVPATKQSKQRHQEQN